MGQIDEVQPLGVVPASASPPMYVCGLLCDGDGDDVAVSLYRMPVVAWVVYDTYATPVIAEMLPVDWCLDQAGEFVFPDEARCLSADEALRMLKQQAADRKERHAAQKQSKANR